MITQGDTHVKVPPCCLLISSKFQNAGTYFKNLIMQSMQIGFELTSSMKTLAGCMSSRAMRSDM